MNERATHFQLSNVFNKVLFVIIQLSIYLIVYTPAYFYPLIGKFVYAVMLVTAPKEVRQIFTNLQRVRNLPPHSGVSKRFAKQVLENQIFCLLETLRIIFRPNTPHQVQGSEEFFKEAEKLQSQGKGLIYISGHIGSWELAAKYAAIAFKGQLYVLAKPTPNSGLNQFVEWVRHRMRTNILWANTKTILKEMLRVMQANQALGFVMDQKPEGRKGERFDFLGHAAEFVGGPALMATRADCPVIGIFCVREYAWHYRLIHVTICEKDTSQLAPQALTRSMVDAIEKMICQYPESWTWNYKRWKFS